MYYDNVFVMFLKVSFIILVLVGFLHYYTKSIDKKKENFKKYEHERENKKIPLDIYQTWYTKNLPPAMKRCVDRLKFDNPEFTHHLYDDKMCREFIKNKFDKSVLQAFDKLKPGAYKADLWRYCILYKKGGIYLDIKYQCEPGFKLIELIDTEQFVLERPYIDPMMSNENNLELIQDIRKYINLSTEHMWKNKEIGIYNALIVCKPNNKTMYKCIMQCVKNINSNYYGVSSIAPTGPILCGKKYFRSDSNNIDKINLFYSINGLYILNKRRPILKQYDEYYKTDNAQKPSYHIMWQNRDIYN
jgi:hypothetical protein